MAQASAGQTPFGFAFDNRDHLIIVSEAFSDTADASAMSSYEVGNDGSLTILDANGVTAMTGAGPADVALSLNGLFLNVLNAGEGSISTYLILPHGALVHLGTDGTLAAGSYGLASK